MTIDVVKLAREAGLGMMLKDDDMPHDMWEEELARFAALVIEECAKKCESLPRIVDGLHRNVDGDTCAAALRQMKGTT